MAKKGKFGVFMQHRRSGLVTKCSACSEDFTNTRSSPVPRAERMAVSSRASWWAGAWQLMELHPNEHNSHLPRPREGASGEICFKGLLIRKENADVETSTNPVAPAASNGRGKTQSARRAYTDLPRRDGLTSVFGRDRWWTERLLG